MWKNIVELGRPKMTIWRMRIACWIPKVTNTHSEYVILIAFLRQEWLREFSSMLCCMYSTMAVLFILNFRPLYHVISLFLVTNYRILVLWDATTFSLVAKCPNFWHCQDRISMFSWNASINLPNYDVTSHKTVTFILIPAKTSKFHLSGLLVRFCFGAPAASCRVCCQGTLRVLNGLLDRAYTAAGEARGCCEVCPASLLFTEVANLFELYKLGQVK